MDLWICESCGSTVRKDQIRARCAVCGKRTCVVCARVCDSCKKIVCPDCIRLREVWRQGKLYFMNICDSCWKRLIW